MSGCAFLRGKLIIESRVRTKMPANRRTGIDAKPNFGHLANERSRALVIQLRSAVEPILANNILCHFTDHSVSHSDNVCELVDALVENLHTTNYQLSEDELIVLYSSCYLHDVGMQYEK